MHDEQRTSPSGQAPLILTDQTRAWALLILRALGKLIMCMCSFKIHTESTVFAKHKDEAECPLYVAFHSQSNMCSRLKYTW